MQGLGLALRMARHCVNAQALAEHLKQHEAVAWVNYAGLPDSPYFERCQRLCGGKASGIMSFGIKGGEDAGAKFIDALQLILRLVNIGDAKSLACHPASTTHRQLGPEELADAGVSPDMIRLSVGIEHIDDIIADVDQALPPPKARGCAARRPPGDEGRGMEAGRGGAPRLCSNSRPSTSASCPSRPGRTEPGTPSMVPRAR